MDKTSIVFYKDWFDVISELTEEEQLQIYNAVFRYAFYGEVPQDRFVKAITIQMRSAIDIENEKYKEICERRKEAGIKGNQIRWGNRKSQMVANVNKISQKSQMVANATEVSQKSQMVANVANATINEKTSNIKAHNQLDIDKTDTENAVRDENIGEVQNLKKNTSPYTPSKKKAVYINNNKKDDNKDLKLFNFSTPPIIPPSSSSESSKENNNGPQPEKGKTTRFIPPSIEEVEAYIREKNYGIDAETFWNFYESKGWMVGKNKMKNWKAALVTWRRMEDDNGFYRNNQNNTNNGNKRNEIYRKERKDSQWRYDKRRGTEITATCPEDYEGPF